MKRLLPALACCVAGAAAAAQAPIVRAYDPADAPQTVEMRGDGRCTTVRPGDTVHYTLSIDNVIAAHAVLGDLQLRPGHLREVKTRAGLPAPDFHALGGGGVGKRDADEARDYHFAFVVPEQIYSGTYRGVGIWVSAHDLRPGAVDDPYAEYAAPYLPRQVEHTHVHVTKRTQREVHAYCLNVESNFGFQQPRATVVAFEPGPVDPPAARPSPAMPTTLPTGPLPIAVQPVAQPK